MAQRWMDVKPRKFVNVPATYHDESFCYGTLASARHYSRQKELMVATASYSYDGKVAPPTNSKIRSRAGPPCTDRQRAGVLTMVRWRHRRTLRSGRRRDRPAPIVSAQAYLRW